MIGYLVRRLGWAVVLFFVLTMVTYIIFFVIPANPALELCGRGCSAADYERVEHYWGLDRPVPVQYLMFVERIVVHQSLGRSFRTRREVNDVVTDAAPVTASLIGGAALMWLLVAFPVGVLSALRPRTLVDRASMVFVLIGISAHPAWVGLIFSYFFGFKLGWFPAFGYCDMINPSTSCGGPVQWAYHLLLPWLSFALLFCALYVRMIRASVLEAMQEDYVRTARAKGATDYGVMRSHILRNAMLPIVTMLGMDLGLLLGGAIFTEAVFGLPGLGRVAFQALNNLDLPMIQGVVVFTALCVLTFNLVVDLVYALLDPRIRLR